MFNFYMEWGQVSESSEMRRQMKAVAHNAELAVRHEEINRKRIESMERVLGGFLGLPFKMRLKWLFFGFPVPPKAESKPETLTEAPDVH